MSPSILFVSNSPEYLSTTAIVFHDFCKEGFYQIFPKHHPSECETSFIQVPGEDASTNPATVMVNCWFGLVVSLESQTTNPNQQFTFFVG